MESYSYISARREAFSRWLAYATSLEVEKELKTNEVLITDWLTDSMTPMFNLPG